MRVGGGGDVTEIKFLWLVIERAFVFKVDLWVERKEMIKLPFVSLNEKTL